MPSDLDAVEIARPRQFDFENLADPPRRRRHDHYSIRKTSRFTHIVGNEDDRLTTFLPNLLDVAIEL